MRACSIVVAALVAGCSPTKPTVHEAGPTSGTPAESTPEEAPVAPASTRELPPVGTAPDWKDLLALAKGDGLKKPAKAAAPVGLGGDRWVAAIRTTDRERGGDEGGAWTTHLLVVDTSANPPRLVERRALVSWAERDQDDPGRAPVAIFADDYDGDGTREILVRFGFTLMLCGIGEVERRELRIYGTDDAGKLRAQVALTLDDRIYYGATTGREAFADKTGDGRADLVVTERSDYEDVDNTNGGKPIRGKKEIVYAYLPEHDEYVRADSKTARGRARNDFRMWDTCEEGESPGSSAL